MVVTDKGTIPLYKFRIKRLMNESSDNTNTGKYDKYWDEIIKIKFDNKEGKYGTIEGIDIYVVDGNEVKIKHDMNFVEGGNDCRYKYMPKNTIWIDKNIDVDNYKFIAFHEFIERKLMDEKRFSYNKAHGIANKKELEKRKIK